MQETIIALALILEKGAVKMLSPYSLSIPFTKFYFKVFFHDYIVRDVLSAEPTTLINTGHTAMMKQLLPRS